MSETKALREMVRKLEADNAELRAKLSDFAEARQPPPLEDDCEDPDNRLEKVLLELEEEQRKRAVAESALATLRQVDAESWVEELIAAAAQWGDFDSLWERLTQTARDGVERDMAKMLRRLLTDVLKATPAEHPDTATLRAIRERAKDMRAGTELLGNDDVRNGIIAALGVVLGDSGPSGGGEEMCQCDHPHDWRRRASAATDASVTHHSWFLGEKDRADSAIRERDEARDTITARDARIAELEAEVKEARSAEDHQRTQHALMRIKHERSEGMLSRFIGKANAAESALATLRQAVRETAGSLRSTADFLRHRAKAEGWAEALENDAANLQLLGEAVVHLLSWAETLENDAKKAEKALSSIPAEHPDTGAQRATRERAKDVDALAMEASGTHQEGEDLPSVPAEECAPAGPDGPVGAAGVSLVQGGASGAAVAGPGHAGEQSTRAAAFESAVLAAIREWPTLGAMVLGMASKLERHKPRKGGRESWLKDSPDSLLERILDEVEELVDAFVENPEDRETLGNEGFDVANMVMMFLDSLGTLCATAERT